MKSISFAIGMALAMLIAACVPQLTGNVTADTQANLAKLQAFAPQVQAYNTQTLNTIAQFNAGVVTDAVAVGKAACGDAAMLNGEFQLAAPAMAAAAVDPKVAATEGAVMAGVNLGCAVVDAANPTTPQATVASAVSSVVQALPQLKQSLTATGVPAASQAATPLPVKS